MKRQSKLNFNIRYNKLKHTLGAVLALALVGGITIGTYDYTNHGTVQHHYRETRHIQASYLADEVIDHSTSDRLSNEQGRPLTGLSAKSAILVNGSQHKILGSKDAHQLRKVASVAKLMTLYLVQRKANRQQAWGHVVPQTNEKSLRKMSYDTKHGTGGFKFKRGHRYTVRQLYQAALVGSSNNSAIALGEWTAGSNAKFIRMMNQQARAWHLDGHFVSASGLENDSLSMYGLAVRGGKKAGNELSAHDIAVIACHLLHDFPNVTRWSSQPNIKIDGQMVYNVNSLLPGQTYYNPNAHVDGLKAGFTPSAGYCFVGTGKRNGQRIISVVLNDQKEFNDTKTLLG